MDGRIGALHIRYKVPASMPQVHGSLPGLERVARTQLAEACEAAFDHVMGDDSAVYVIRQVSAKLAIASPSSSLSVPIARAWGERIAGAATRVLARGDEGIDFVRFDDQANFVARFLVDLIQQDAARLWFYGVFRKYLELTVEQAIVHVLEDNRAFLTAILRQLRERGQLYLVLSKLTAEGASRVCGRPRELDLPTLGPIEAHRPLLAAALGIARALGMLVVEPQEDDLSWYHEVRVSLVAPALVPDWKDPIQLASIVICILSHLHRRSLVKWAGDAVPLAIDRATEILADRFDWLPLNWMVPRLLTLRISNPQVVERTPERAGPTPRQKQFLDVLLRLVRENRLDRDPARTGTSHDQLRIRAALAEAAPHFADDPQLLTLLDLILVARAGTAQPSTIAEAAEYDRARKIVDALGATAQEIVRELAIEPLPSVAHATVRAIETECGALFLLTRGCIDLRLEAILKSVGVTSSAAFLAALASKIGGDASDPAQRSWAGYEGDNPWHDLEDFPLRLFKQALFRQVVAQRHISPHSCSVEEIEWRGQPAAVAADPNASAWPLAVFGEADEALEQWAALAETNVDREPTRKFFLDAYARLATPIDACTPAMDLMLTITAGCVLRAWARWLRGIGDSTPAYLLKNALDRKAFVYFGERSINVTVAAAPLDSIVDLSGYFAPIASVPWLANRQMRFIRGPR